MGSRNELTVLVSHCVSPSVGRHIVWFIECVLYLAKKSRYCDLNRIRLLIKRAAHDFMQRKVAFFMANLAAVFDDIAIYAMKSCNRKVSCKVNSLSVRWSADTTDVCCTG